MTMMTQKGEKNSEGKLKDLRLRVESTATEVPERIADVRDEELSEEIGSDTVDTPRHQIYKKRRRIVGCARKMHRGS